MTRPRFIRGLRIAWTSVHPADIVDSTRIDWTRVSCGSQFWGLWPTWSVVIKAHRRVHGFTMAIHFPLRTLITTTLLEFVLGLSYGIPAWKSSTHATLATHPGSANRLDSVWWVIFFRAAGGYEAALKPLRSW